MHNGNFVKSKFTLYSDNYKYEEIKESKAYITSGQYEISDSSIVFDYKLKDQIPTHYISSAFELLRENKVSKLLKIKVVSTEGHSVLFATIMATDNKGQFVDSVETGFDGYAWLEKNSLIETLNIQYVGFSNHMVKYDALQNYEVLFRMEPLKPGGRMSPGCVITELDVLLEYRISDNRNLKEFERNGIIFTKVE